MNIQATSVISQRKEFLQICFMKINEILFNFFFNDLISSVCIYDFEGKIIKPSRTISDKKKTYFKIC